MSLSTCWVNVQGTSYNFKNHGSSQISTDVKRKGGAWTLNCPGHLVIIHVKSKIDSPSLGENNCIYEGV